MNTEERIDWLQRRIEVLNIKVQHVLEELRDLPKQQVALETEIKELLEEISRLQSECLTLEENDDATQVPIQ